MRIGLRGARAGQPQRDAARAVAGDLGLAAVGVEDANGGVVIGAFGAVEDDPAVGSDAGVAVADGDGEFLQDR